MTEKEIYLNILKSAVNGRLFNLDVEIDNEKLWEFAKLHYIRATIAKSLLGGFITDEEWKAKWKEALSKNIRKTILIDLERDKISDALSREKIWYAPLKGVMINRLYPKYGMREFADNDILVNREFIDKTIPIMESLGYTYVNRYEPIHYSFYKKPLFTFELHYRLFREKVNNEKIYNYFKDFDSKLVSRDDNEYSLYFSDDDGYLYFFAHTYNHYNCAGLGLRTLADIYLYLTKKDLNRDYIESELEKIGLSEFAYKMESLSVKLFSGEEPFVFDSLSESETNLLNEIIEMGYYGDKNVYFKNRFNDYVQSSGKNSKMGYFISRTFPDIENYRDSNPFIYKHKSLYPFLYISRPFRALALNRKAVFKEIKSIKRYKPKD